ncbi:TPA: phage head morphogenesis protein [Salmonella enterica]|uniref:Phage head morphogenesis protein n=1 Tax=Salmonella enterica TaxID=28901 RepID=A0A743T0M1_SALER|nr:phage head morphogenesis protein [Salmonella enterica subsp. enterica serovar Bredeney]HAF2157347.1 phage head morphogenesis protein [Salmonella enterica]HAK7841012.1 phage head morphogenesis protein [Salmonella enterica]HAK8652375.1 phage head morphogenesis protein [Salmonella enterica]
MPDHDGFDLAWAMGLPPAEAVAYFESKGYAIGLHWYDVEAAAQAKAFTVAGVLKLDVLADIRRGMQDILNSGGTLQDFERQLTPVLERKGWLGKGLVVDEETGELHGKRLMPRRLETIFRTNMQSAYMAGRWRQQMATVGTHPYLQYVAVMDRRTRPSHAALDGRIFRYDDPGWGAFYPPNGYNCRCRVRALTPEQAEAETPGPESTDGRLETVDQEYGIPGQTRKATGFRDPKTGQLFVPDPGFGINPGQVAWQPELDKYETRPARQYITASLTGPDFARGYAQAKAGKAQAAQSYPVAMRDGEPGQRRMISLMQTDMAAQVRRDSPVTLADYLLAQQAIESPTRVIDVPPLRCYALEWQDGWVVSVVREHMLTDVRRGPVLDDLLPEA